MVVSSVVVVTVANVSAELWQKVACISEHVTRSELIDIICCLPIEQLGRLAFCLWTFFCLPPSPDSSSFYSYYYNNYYDDDDDDDESDRDTSSDSSRSFYYGVGGGVDDGGYNSHSD